ncbi:MAG: metalloregulator ArsR/SmtB family transcription factor [bacterium]|nr:metalloregulator ArsR/SmtB family transcription factor [bacterium]
MQNNARGLEKILKAIANRRRLAIVKHLQKAKVSTVGDVAEKIQLSFRATSKHLSVLHAADIVEREQVGLTMNYSLTNPPHLLVRTAANLL